MGVPGNGEARSSNGREGEVLGEMFPFPPARGSVEHCSKLSSGNLAIQNVLYAYEAAPSVDFADIKFLSVKFS